MEHAIRCQLRGDFASPICCLGGDIEDVAGESREAGQTGSSRHDLEWRNSTSPPLTCFNKQSRSTIGVWAGTFATLAFLVSSMASELVLPLSGFDRGISDHLMLGSYSVGTGFAFLFFSSLHGAVMGGKKVHSRLLSSNQTKRRVRPTDSNGYEDDGASTLLPWFCYRLRYPCTIIC
jgi:hypothetical protein